MGGRLLGHSTSAAMKIAFAALVTTIPIRLAAAAAVTPGSNGNVELVWSGAATGTDYVKGSAPATITYTFTLTTQRNANDAFFLTSTQTQYTHTLFNQVGELKVDSFVQGSTTLAVTDCTVQTGNNNVKCTLTGTSATVQANAPAVIKLSAKGTT